MKQIDPDSKVAHLVEKYPETWETFKSHGCPDMRGGFFSLMARIMSIRNAARIHRIPLDTLLRDLEKTCDEAGPGRDHEGGIGAGPDQYR